MNASPQDEAVLCSSCPQLCRDGKFRIQPTVPCAVHSPHAVGTGISLPEKIQLYVVTGISSLSTHMCSQKWALRIMHFTRQTLFQGLTHRVYEASFSFYGFEGFCSLLVVQISSPSSVSPDQNPTQTTTVFKSLNQTRETSVSS